MKAVTKGVLIGAGAVAAVTAAAAGVLPELLVRVATDRKEPRMLHKARVRATQKLCNTKAYAGVASSEQRLAAARLQRIRTVGVDGTPLVGHWYPCSEPKRILIAMHGWRSSWARDFGASADFWHENGCSILFAEQRAQGNSGGDYLGFGIMERYDCLSWANHIYRTENQTLPVYLAGISMGATTVLLAAELPLPPNVRGIIADCGFSSPEAIWHYVTQQKLHIPYRMVKGQVNKLCKKRFGCLPNEASTVHALKKSKLPVLLIHGEKDDFVPMGMSVEAKNACASKCDLLIVPGARHGESYLKATWQYQMLVQEFWREND